MRAPETFLSPLPVDALSGYGREVEVKDNGKAS